MDLAKEYPFTRDCFEQETQLAQLRTDIAYYHTRGIPSEAVAREKLLKQREELFKVLGCPLVIEHSRQSETKKVFDKYAVQSKSRIEAANGPTEYAYIIIGIAVLALGVLIASRKN